MGQRERGASLSCSGALPPARLTSSLRQGRGQNAPGIVVIKASNSRCQTKNYTISQVSLATFEGFIIFTFIYFYIFLKCSLVYNTSCGPPKPNVDHYCSKINIIRNLNEGCFHRIKRLESIVFTFDSLMNEAMKGRFGDNTCV
jgi:hypothetical protein